MTIYLHLHRFSLSSPEQLLTKRYGPYELRAMLSGEETTSTQGCGIVDSCSGQDVPSTDGIGLHEGGGWNCHSFVKCLGRSST